MWPNLVGYDLGDDNRGTMEANSWVKLVATSCLAMTIGLYPFFLLLS
jgi:hypothetical protein